MGRFGTVEEFANIACFLVSDAASYISGSAINVDGAKSPVAVRRSKTRVATEQWRQKTILFAPGLELPPLSDGLEKSPYSSNPNRSTILSASPRLFRSPEIRARQRSVHF
jgi:hypothetical protein